MASSSEAATAAPTSVGSQAQDEVPEQRTARHFAAIRNDPLLLRAFLRQMPKG
jgi:hypothetical protein